MNFLLGEGTTPDWVVTLVNAVLDILNPILILVAVAGIIYAIVVGVRFAKADDKSQRDEAKQKLITVIIGIVVTFLLVALFFWIKENIGTWLDALDDGKLGNNETTTPSTPGGDVVTEVAISFIRAKIGL